MKLKSTLATKLLAFGLAAGLSMLATVAQAQMKDGKAVVRAVRGQAQYMDAPGGQWAPLKVGKVLKAGAVIRTANESTVDLFLDANGPVVRVTPSTEIGLEKLAFSRAGDDTVIDTQLDLKAGTILGNVKKLAAASKYDIKTPVGVCGIRGTEYRVSADGKVTCVTGAIRITYNRPGQAPYIVTITDGQTFDPSTLGVTTETPESLAKIKTDLPAQFLGEGETVPLVQDVPVNLKLENVAETGNNLTTTKELVDEELSKKSPPPPSPGSE